MTGGGTAKIKQLRPSKAAKPAKKAAGGSLECDQCGKPCASQLGLTQHLSRTHGIKPTPERPAPTPEEVAQITATAAADENTLLLRCDDCDFSTAGHSFAKLRTHVMTEHGGRFPSRAESSPRTAAQVDEMSA